MGDSGFDPQFITVDLPIHIPPTENSNSSFNRLMKTSLLRNYPNFKRSAPPERLMYYKSGSWIRFHTAVVELAREAFLRENPTPEIIVDGNRCVFDFYKMLQIDVINSVQRSIAWIDLNKSCYFPKLFVDESFGVKIEIKLGKRVRELGLEVEGEYVDTADSSSKKARIEQLKWPKTRLVKEEERAYAAVRELFLAGMRDCDSGVEVTSIYQFDKAGVMERARWEVFRKQNELMKAARGADNMVFAWHGTSREGVEKKLARGFGLPSKVCGPKAHGVGVYLSSMRSPHLSHMLAEADDNGERHLMLCRVILGSTEKVEVGSQQYYPSSVNYDTGVDNISNPKWYVVWSKNMNTHILPECVISYKCSSRVQGSLPAPELFKLTKNEANSGVARLFYELRRKLPPLKLEALKSLFVSYKVGGLARDTFITKLRSVAGDVMLRSIMREMRGIQTS